MLSELAFDDRPHPFNGVELTRVYGKPEYVEVLRKQSRYLTVSMCTVVVKYQCRPNRWRQTPHNFLHELKKFGGIRRHSS